MPTHSDDGSLHVVVETPAGSRIKLVFDRDLEAFMLSRPMPLGLAYPFDWGFVPGTLAADGDPLDALVIQDAATFPGVVVACRPIGVLRVTQKRKGGGGRERNDRLIAVPAKAPRLRDRTDARALPARVRREIEAFFLGTTRFERKDLRILGWGGPADARRRVRESSQVPRPGTHRSGKSR